VYKRQDVKHRATSDINELITAHENQGELLRLSLGNVDKLNTALEAYQQRLAEMTDRKDEYRRLNTELREHLEASKHQLAASQAELFRFYKALRLETRDRIQSKQLKLAQERKNTDNLRKQLAASQAEVERLRASLLTVLDMVDYTAEPPNCRLNAMVGAALPKQVIEIARQALEHDPPRSPPLLPKAGEMGIR